MTAGHVRAGYHEVISTSLVRSMWPHTIPLVPETAVAPARCIEAPSSALLGLFPRPIPHRLQRRHQKRSPGTPPPACVGGRLRGDRRGLASEGGGSRRSGVRERHCRCNIRRDWLAVPTAAPGLTRPHLRRDRLPTSAPGFAAKSAAAPGLICPELPKGLAAEIHLRAGADCRRSLEPREFWRISTTMFGTICHDVVRSALLVHLWAFRVCRALHCMRRRRRVRRPLVPWKHGACPESWRRCGRFSRGGRAACQFRRRCGRGAPSPGADVGHPCRPRRCSSR